MNPPPVELTYWFMAAITGAVKFILAFRRPGTAGDKLLATADGLTAIVVWRALSTVSIWLYAVMRVSSWGKWLPPVPDEGFSALAVLVALAGVKESVAFLMRFKLVRERVDEEETKPS